MSEDKSMMETPTISMARWESPLMILSLMGLKDRQRLTMKIGSLKTLKLVLRSIPWLELICSSLVFLLLRLRECQYPCQCLSWWRTPAITPSLIILTPPRSQLTRTFPIYSITKPRSGKPQETRRRTEKTWFKKFSLPSSQVPCHSFTRLARASFPWLNISISSFSLVSIRRASETQKLVSPCKQLFKPGSLPKTPFF